MMDVRKYAKWLAGAGLADESEIVGLSTYEIAGIEHARSISLPDDYKEFLSQCGRCAGMFGRDIDILYPHFLKLNGEFLEVAEEFGIGYRPPINAYFFSAYQGGSFHYFVCGGNDASVYVLNDGDVAPNFVSESFSSFMLGAVSSYQDALLQKPDKSWMLYADDGEN